MARVCLGPDAMISKYKNQTATQEIADGINQACPLVEAPDIASPAWNVIFGREVREYFNRSPYATVTAYQRGFVVTNLVTGGRHPVATWVEASSLRAALANRYATIQNVRF